MPDLIIFLLFTFSAVVACPEIIFLRGTQCFASSLVETKSSEFLEISKLIQPKTSGKEQKLIAKHTDYNSKSKFPSKLHKFSGKVQNSLSVADSEDFLRQHEHNFV